MLGCNPLFVCSIKVFTDLSDKFPVGGGKGQACGGYLWTRGLDRPLSAQLGTCTAFRNGQEKTEHWLRRHRYSSHKRDTGIHKQEIIMRLSSNESVCSDSSSTSSSASSSTNFSYYSINSDTKSKVSSVPETPRAKTPHMANYVSTLRTTLKWRSLVLEKRNTEENKQKTITIKFD